MDATPLGFKIGQTPFDEIEEINFGSAGYSCGTGDSFVTQTPKLKTDLVDMEAYAIAKICYLKDIKFRCLNISLIMLMRVQMMIGLKMFLMVRNYSLKG